MPDVSLSGSDDAGLDEASPLVAAEHFVQDRTMTEGPDFAEPASLMGDPARAQMLTALLDGRAWTATELAFEASVAPSTASAHLARLLAGGLLSDVRQGRHRYFRLASGDVATAIEALMALSVRTSLNKRLPGPRDQRLRHARTCYDHLAGSLGVKLFTSLVVRQWLRAEPRGWAFTAEGAANFAKVAQCPRSALEGHGRSCLDWSERREHLGGSLGKAILAALVDSRLAELEPGRLVVVTESGKSRMEELTREMSDGANCARPLDPNQE
jgi:DNA-binding transcriptional ArsR family regulator